MKHHTLESIAASASKKMEQQHQDVQPHTTTATTTTTKNFTRSSSNNISKKGRRNHVYFRISMIVSIMFFSARLYTWKENQASSLYQRSVILWEWESSFVGEGATPVDNDDSSASSSAATLAEQVVGTISPHKEPTVPAPGGENTAASSSIAVAEEKEELGDSNENDDVQSSSNITSHDDQKDDRLTFLNDTTSNKTGTEEAEKEGVASNTSNMLSTNTANINETESAQGVHQELEVVTTTFNSNNTNTNANNTIGAEIIEAEQEEEVASSTTAAHGQSTMTPASSAQKNPYRIQYPDYRSRFPVPDWLEEYLSSQPLSEEAHIQMLQDPNEKFIVMTCDKYRGNKQEECGGLSDRLKQLPFFLWLAHKHNRRFLIRYTKPSPLENFLVPPDDGQFDWRLPDGYFEAERTAYVNRDPETYKRMRRFHWDKRIHLEPWNTTRVIFVNNNMAMDNIMSNMTLTGMHQYDVFPGIFRRMFQPSEGVWKVIEETAEQNNLTAGNYAAAHLRLKWPIKPPNRLIRLANAAGGDKKGGGLNLDSNETVWNYQILADNVIDCAMQIMPETKRIYFSSDSNEPVEYLAKESPWSGRNQTNRSIEEEIPKVVTHLDVEEEPIHFDMAHIKDPTKLYPLFVDLWILSHAKCTSHGKGGFPRFVSVLAGNLDTCHMYSWPKQDAPDTYCPHYLNRFGFNLPNRTVIPC